jgi:hypothetical protein
MTLEYHTQLAGTRVGVAFRLENRQSHFGTLVMDPNMLQNPDSYA